jgi:hypothetical protein
LFEWHNYCFIRIIREIKLLFLWQAEAITTRTVLLDAEQAIRVTRHLRSQLLVKNPIMETKVVDKDLNPSENPAINLLTETQVWID